MALLTKELEQNMKNAEALKADILKADCMFHIKPIFIVTECPAAPRRTAPADFNELKNFRI